MRGSPRNCLAVVLLILTMSGNGFSDEELQFAMVENEDGETTVSFVLGDSPVLRVRDPEFPHKSSVNVQMLENGWRRVTYSWALDEPLEWDDLALELDLFGDPDFHWMPHLAPQDNWVVAQHVFRSPALLAAKGRRVLAVVPDLDLVGQREGNPWYLDLDAPEQKAWLGMSLTEIPVHVGYTKKEGMVLEPGTVELAFFVSAWEAPGPANAPVNPWGRVSRFLWEGWGRDLYNEGEPLTVPMDTYVQHTYDWAFDRWAHAVWQEFEVGGTKVGAPQFIVNVTQSPNHGKPWSQREFLSIWNQAWFSSLRSASGLARWAERTGNPELAEKAALTKALALAAPQADGVFPSVIATRNEAVEVEGQTVRRPRPWAEAYWTNSNRCPGNFGITPEWFHVLDSSWTALLLLRWHEEIESEERLVEYARAWAEKLLTLQDTLGFFPGWLHPETHVPGPIMNQTPETSMSVTFLLKMHEVTGEMRYREAALKAMDAVLVEIVPEGRWEDFETYWSCCGFGREEMVGRKFERNNMYKQNNFSMFWTAEALLASYRATGEKRYLDWGRRTLDELSMCQQVWQPPFIYVPALGGFGVMNFDAEWNDSRQSLFAELFLDYYKVTGDPHLFERGVAALKASFNMMYCPENPQQKEQWEKAHPFFGPEDYGFMMENYGHDGHTSPEGIGIGTFTIYDWGNGAASEARNRVRDHYGDVYIDRQRERGFGIDSIRVEKSGNHYELVDLAGTPRTVRVMFEDGNAREVELDGRAVVAAE